MLVDILLYIGIGMIVNVLDRVMFRELYASIFAMIDKKKNLNGEWTKFMEYSSLFVFILIWPLLILAHLKDFIFILSAKK